MPEVIEWLRAQPDGISPTVEQLVIRRQQQERFVEWQRREIEDLTRRLEDLTRRLEDAELVNLGLRGADIIRMPPDVMAGVIEHHTETIDALRAQIQRRGQLTNDRVSSNLDPRLVEWAAIEARAAFALYVSRLNDKDPDADDWREQAWMKWVRCPFNDGTMLAADLFGAARIAYHEEIQRAAEHLVDQ